jgi:hypothetical protein
MQHHLSVGASPATLRRSPDVSRVAEAANFLITATHYEALRQELITIVNSWDSAPRAYGGSHAVLNALIDVGVDNRPAFDRMLAIVEAKRALLPTARKVDYQRNLMRERRQREYKALAVYEKATGLVRGKQRAGFFRDMRATWAAAKAEFMLARGHMSYDEKLEATALFWQGVDASLDQALGASHAQ